MNTLGKLLRHPLILVHVVVALLRVRRKLLTNRFAELVREKPIAVPRLVNLTHWNYADWVLKFTCSRWRHPSPCLCHALVHYRLGGAGTRLRISAMKDGELAAHASVFWGDVEFTMAESWKNQPIFAEFTNGIVHAVS